VVVLIISGSGVNGLLLWKLHRLKNEMHLDRIVDCLDLRGVR
jgi:hypothetical protein